MIKRKEAIRRLVSASPFPAHKTAVMAVLRRSCQNFARSTTYEQGSQECVSLPQIADCNLALLLVEGVLHSAERVSPILPEQYQNQT